MDIQSRVVTGAFWHGMSEAAWHVVSHGGGLRLPEPGEHKHDPGDYGLAVYFTDCKAKAKTYAARLVGDKLALVLCRIELENAVVFDWREGSALDTKHPTNQQTDFFEKLYGDPIHGSPEDRRRVAETWRTRMLASGYDGVIVMRRDETELAVYRPEQSIKEISTDSYTLTGGNHADTA